MLSRKVLHFFCHALCDDLCPYAIYSRRCMCGGPGKDRWTSGRLHKSKSSQKLRYGCMCDDFCMSSMNRCDSVRHAQS